MTAFSELYPEILSDVPQADSLLLDRSIRRAVRQFCDRTQVVRVTDTLDVVANQSEYTLPAVTNREIIRLVRQGVWWGIGSESFTVTAADLTGAFGYDGTNGAIETADELTSGATIQAIFFNSAGGWLQIETDEDISGDYSSVTVAHEGGEDVLLVSAATSETPSYGDFALRFAAFSDTWAEADYAVKFTLSRFDRKYMFGHKSEDLQGLDHRVDQTGVPDPWQVETQSYPDAFGRSSRPYYFQRRPSLINIWPIPSASGSDKIQVTYSVMPDRTATEVDDLVFDWYELLAAGALAELLAIKHKPWTDLRESDIKRRMFTQGIAAVVAERVSGFADQDGQVGRVKAWP